MEMHSWLEVNVTYLGALACLPGTINSQYYSAADWHSDSYVKVFISGTSGVSKAVANDHTPAWASTLDMGCPSNEDATLNLQMFEVYRALLSTMTCTEVILGVQN